MNFAFYKPLNTVVVKRFLLLLTLVCSQTWTAQAADPIFPPEGIDISKTIMLDSKVRIDELQKAGFENSKAQSAILSTAYNQLLKEELKKSNPDKAKINRWYMNQAAKILNLDAETAKFFKSNLEAINPNNPFMYRSKDGKNYMAFPALKSGSLKHGSLVSVEEHFNAHVRDVSVLQNAKNSANPRHVQFFPREYTRFMSVSYAVTWEMCQVQWASAKSILSFESVYRIKNPGEKKDPLCEEHFIKSLQDPVGWLGFYGFIMTNHALSPRISNYAFAKLGASLANSKLPFLQQRIAFSKFITNIFANGLGMAAGLTVSDYIHQLKENPNLKECFKDIPAAGWFGQHCMEAYKDFLLINSAAQDRMIISSSSLLLAFLMNTASQVPLQMAVHGARLGLHATKHAITHGIRAGMHVALGLIPLGPAGWVAGAVIYIGSTYLFLRFDHMISPWVEQTWYNVSKPWAVRNSIDHLVRVVKDQEHLQWQKPIGEREEGETCLKEKISNMYNYLVENNYVKRVFEGNAKCDNPILLDEALTDFSLAMSEHRNLNILSGVSSTVGIWQNKWAGFYYNYMGSMRMLDTLAGYRRTHKERLNNYVEMNHKYGFDPAKRSSVEIFDELYNPLYGFETDLLSATNAVYGHNGRGIDHEGLVRNVHQWIRDGIADADHKFRNRPTITWKTHFKPYLESLLKEHDPLILAEKLLKLRDMLKGYGHFATNKITRMLDKVYSPVFPFASDYLGAAQAHQVPVNKHFMELLPEEQEDLFLQRQAAKCQGSIDGEGVCSLTPEEILELVDSYIPMMDSISVDLGYENSAGSRYDVNAIVSNSGYEHPNTFDPNCTTFSPFGSDNPICWFSKGLKDSQGNPYNARFKTPQFSDQLLANMACGISNRPYLTTSDGPKNFIGSGSLYKSENFSALFTPPNLIKGAPACETIGYSFGGHERRISDTADLHRSFIRINNKTYYGALSLITDPTNPWIINDDISSVENYWNTHIFPTAKEVAQNLFKEYQKVIIDKLLPLFSEQSQDIDYNNLMNGKNQVNLFDEGRKNSDPNDHFEGWFAPMPYQYNHGVSYIPEYDLAQYTTKNLRESFIQQARLYLQLTQRVSNLSDRKAEELLSAINMYITTMQRSAVDYNLEGEAFIREMNVKKAYHDNIMEKRSQYLTRLVDETFDEVGSSIEWISKYDRQNFMGTVKTVDAFSDLDELVLLRVLDFLITLKNDNNRPNDADLFGTNNYYLKQSLLFETGEVDDLAAYLRPLFYQFDRDEISAEQLYEKLKADSENAVIKLVRVERQDLFKDWALQRIKGDVLGLIGELKAQYLDEWIHGSKFYLNNLQLTQ